MTNRKILSPLDDSMGNTCKSVYAAANAHKKFFPLAVMDAGRKKNHCRHILIENISIL